MANEKDLKALETKLKNDENELEKKRAELNKREASIEKRELLASNGYQKQFEEKFAEIQDSFDKREDSLHKREVEISKKEIAIQEKESKLNEKLSQYKLEQVAKVKEEVEKYRSEQVSKITQEIQNLKNDSAQLIDSLNSQIADLTQKLTEAKNDSAIAVSTKNSNEKTIKDLQAEISARSEDYQKVVTERDSLKSQNSVLDNQVQEQNKQIESQLKEIKKFENLKSLMGDKSLDSLISEITELSEKSENLKEEKESIEEKERSIQFKEKLLSSKENRIEQQTQEFDAEVEKRAMVKINLYNDEIERLKQENLNLQKEIEAQKRSKKVFEDYEELGEKTELLSEVEKYKKLVEELSTKVKLFPGEYAEIKLEQIHQSEENIKNEMADIEIQKQQIEDVRKENISLKQQLNDSEFRLAETKKSCDTLQAELNRYTAGNEKDVADERNRRIEEINKPLLQFSGENNPARFTEEKQPASEKEWLSNIKQNITDYGLVFPDRIINAFQTSLKCAEISPLTVLGGVSGTGKSELVRLYAHFGGLNFLSIPVQPNWSCPEDMLGFFNSLDNRFEPQEVLRYLAQAQRDPGKDNQEGLSDVMNIVLLDEMNLANPELYFADFLSKLETRRGLDDDHVPSIDVKIGSGLVPYQLKLTRNVLWTGTMNNDETTKTLSDKVLDRGIIINFPRPKNLESRKVKTLPEKSPLISRETWNKWLNAAYVFENEQIKRYKDKINQINGFLGNTGRALGHRVWQSIETYMSNYPLVISANDDTEREKAMKLAFEDQLVQKVMPKLRGLENRGSQGECLENIEGIIPETLKTDFETATKFANGQSFMWCTSDYMNEETVKEPVKEAEKEPVKETQEKENEKKNKLDVFRLGRW